VADVLARPRAAADLGGALRRLGGLRADEVEQIRLLPLPRYRWRPGANLLIESRDASPQIVLSGWVSRQRLLRDGRRLILDFLVAGDGLGFASEEEPRLREKFVAMTPAETIDAAAFAAFAASGGPNSGLARALAAMRRQDHARLLDHMMRLGRLTAVEKIAHFLLEMERRVGGAEAGGGRGFRLPLTQEAIGDALGLSIVHVNRVLRQLRAEKLISIHGGLAWVLAPEKLAALAVLEPRLEA
jgi:CRP-like cAMP-binding protein